MADILVTCPTCKTQLEIDAAYEGQEVECGSCLQVFVATTKKARGSDDPSDRSGSGGKVRGSTSPSGRGSSRSRSSRDDDDDRGRGRRRDDDYDPDYAPRRRQNQGSSGLAIASLILGILGLVPGCFCCWAGFPMSLIATVLGGVAMSKPEGKGMGIAGLVLGICGMIANFIKGLLTGGI